MTASRSLRGPLLGCLLLLHGLGNAVLPLRGVDVTAPGTWALWVSALYVVAILGFVAAGLGILGVRPLSIAVLPAVWAASLAALGAHLRAHDADLWPGVALSLALPMLATAYALSTEPVARVQGSNGWRRGVRDVLGVAFLVWVGVSAAAWPWHRAWGTISEEWHLALPGDRDPRTPQLEILHGVTIDAPPAAIWPWLAQLGQDRAGFYSYDWLERLFGADVHNVDDLRPEWQTRRVGQRIPATQAGYLGGLFGDRPGWIIDVFEPGRALVLRHWGAFVLVPQPDGRTRLLIRSTISDERIPAWAAALNMTAFELPHFIMQRRMLLGIKTRAERTAT
jgi:hypothetical protein